MPRTVAVDLTPVLPGGENGGAKVFALEVVRRLARSLPQTAFACLTQAASHDELAALDGPNVRRVVAVGARASALRPGAANVVLGASAHLPETVRFLVARAGYAAHRMLQRGGAGIVRDLGADLLFCPFTAPTYREPGVAVVCTHYDLQYRAHPSFFSVEDRVARDRAFRDAARCADRIAAISDFAREEAVATGLVPAERIRTVHLRLAATLPPPFRGKVQAALQGRPYLLYPANFWKHKNHEMLLVAFGMARARGLEADLVLTGAPGERSDAIRAAAGRMALGRHVHQPGFLPAPELVSLMAGARALVFPSLYEGFGMPVLEAMALGVPVACGRATALPEVAGGAALLFDARVPESIAAAMLEVVADGPGREARIAAGRQRAREFSDADRMAHEYAALFTEALEARRRA